VTNLALKHQTWIEVTGIDKQDNLPHRGTDYDREKFYSTRLRLSTKITEILRQ
jgi:hypothetical protein